MSDIVREAIEAGAMEKPWNWEPDHPQYVDGTLYLTEAQWNSIKAASESAVDADGRWDRHNRPSLCWGIPVRLIPTGGQITLPDGRVLVHSTVMNALYVIDQRGLRELSPWDGI